MRTTKLFSVENIADFKTKLTHWAQDAQEMVWLDSNTVQDSYTSFEAVLAIDAFTAIKTDAFQAFDKLKEYQEQTKDWIFGCLSYDLKNDVENLGSKNADGLEFPDLYFFQPQKLFFIHQNTVEFSYLRLLDDEIETDFAVINKLEFPDEIADSTPVNLQARISKQAYLEKVGRVLEHIHRGDIYETNFCQEFYAEKARICPWGKFQQLNAISSPPFAAFLKLEHFYALSASPERYIKRTSNKIISQPIKGTARRSAVEEEDQLLAKNLQTDPKEYAENVMIVDLVRNDLSQTATKGSVHVEELCGVYSFKQVHQLISTVISQVEAKTSSVDILRTTFPMGSMTGAPKVSAMSICERLEETKRGLYSGAIGYFSPDGDFDFNVVIRSILYNAQKKYISCSVGGAITAKSIPEKEYEECLLKVKALREVLEG